MNQKNDGAIHHSLSRPWSLCKPSSDNSVNRLSTSSVMSFSNNQIEWCRKRGSNTSAVYFTIEQLCQSINNNQKICKRTTTELLVNSFFCVRTQASIYRYTFTSSIVVNKHHPQNRKLRIYNLLHAARQMEGLDSKYFRVIVTAVTVSKQNNRAHDTHIIKI